ncbi:NACHT domain-containing protein [Nonomuraea sp. NPDC049480]|uniref:NACHT domain-containing protein n=1 Tax=Nonomuraea sp. NPDC049480 TaxID=3364353 RepID=UPI0037BCF7A6
MTKLSPRRRIPLASLAVIAVSMLVVAVWRVWTPGAEVNLADVAAVTLAAATAVGTVVAWARRSTDSTAPAGADAAVAAQVLAGLVERQWRAEARHRLLDDPEPIPVQWQLTADRTVMSRPHLVIPGETPAFAGRSDDIARLAAAFLALSRRRLVITGGPGMGKTTLAMQLLLHLVSTRDAGQGDGEGEIVPVPVLLPISGWDLDAHPRLQDWLAARLARDYPALSAPELGADSAATLAHGGHILPVLDGLDEIPEHTRAQVINALNASLTARDQLILTSRTAEFGTAVAHSHRPLNAAAVITPKLLSPDAAADYLTACLPADPPPSWQNVLTSVRARAAPGLAQLAATPLGLWLIRSIYLVPGADPAPLTGPLGCDAAALRAHLLDQLIPALIQARPPSADPADHFRPRHRLDPLRTHRYLSYLAGHFRATRDIGWWEIARTAPPRVRLPAKLVIGLAAGAVAGLVIGFVAGLSGEPGLGRQLGLPTGLAVLLLLALAADHWVDDPPGYADLRVRGRTAGLIRVAGTREVAVSSAGGFACAFVIGLAGGPLTALALGSAAALVACLTFGLVTWSSQPTLMSVGTPRSSWRADRTLSLVRMVIGFASGLTFGLAFAMALLPGDPARRLAGGLVLGLILGSLGAFLFGLMSHRAWLAFVVFGTGLALARRLPWRIMGFLDDAHRLGLLRAVGPIYQFRHAALHDHLAGHAPAEGPISGSRRRRRLR